MRMSFRLGVVLLVAAGILALAEGGRAQTTVLLSNLPSTNAGYGETTDETWRGFTFTTGTSAFEVSSVTMQLLDYLSAGDDLPVLTLNLSNGSSPGAVVGSFTAPASTDADFQPVVFTPTMAVELDANTDYWLVIAGTSTTNPFYWARSSDTDEPGSQTPTSEVGATPGVQKINYSGGTSATWENGDDGPHSFAIQGSSVPEPGTVVLLVAAGLAVVWRGWGKVRRI